MKKIEINPKTPERIKEFLEEAGLTQKDLAQLVHCSPQHINRIVRGKCGLSVETAEEIAKHYSVRVSYLLGTNDYKTDGAEMKAAIEAEQKEYDKYFRALITLAEASGFTITLEDKWKIKEGDRLLCTCTEDQIEILVCSLILHTKQQLRDFSNIISLCE